jgi:meso-butanediol dehydrogenase/(S,S)-butanediol dehydrogenase/diacetyl reductase
MSTSASGRLAGKRVLITGTGGGQGAAAQRLFAAEGAAVIGCDVRDGAAEATAAALRDEGYDVRASTVDLSDPAESGDWVREGTARLGGLDVLYNNAAGFGFAPFSQMDFALWRHVMSVELDIVFHTTSAAWPILGEEGGSLINVGSYSALRGIEPLAQVAHPRPRAV